MFRLLSLVSLASLSGLTSATVFTQDQIGLFVIEYQGSRTGILDSPSQVFDCDDCADTYQSKAKAQTMGDLAGQDIESFQIRQYYTLACIYHATNGVSNPRTNAVIPGETIPTWTYDDWFSTMNYCEWFGVACFNTLAPFPEQNTQEANKLVVEINLSNNNLYGQFPNEIALVASSVLAIDLYGNFFHWCGDYRWMNALSKLEALFFGSTSWDADGVPVFLRFLTALQELDMSNTFWRGALTENAFNNLKQLRYLDIGQNVFDFDGLSEIPDYITSLPILTNLYIDNIRPSAGSSGGTSLDLGFISRMPNIIEMWADYTNVIGPIPDDIGDAATLQSLSLVYCKLTGTIPNSIVNTQLDRMWLYGNPNLTGGFPAGFGNLDWRFLYLEGTGIDEIIPQFICDQTGIDETQDLTELGANCEICPPFCCSCCGDGCNNLRAPTPAPIVPPLIPTAPPVTPLPTLPSTAPTNTLPTLAPNTTLPPSVPTLAPNTTLPPSVPTLAPNTTLPPSVPTLAPNTTLPPSGLPATPPPMLPTEGLNNLDQPSPSQAPSSQEETPGTVYVVCFTGDSLVEVEHQGSIKMSNLALGDSIKVAGNRFEPVYSFGHKNAEATAEFIAIHADGNRKLELSKAHMIAIEGGRFVPASMVQVGDKLVTSFGDLAVIKTIRTVKRTGVYAPFTESGTIVVNDIVASNYVAFQGSEYLHIAGVETPLDYHRMAHVFNSVHRIAYKIGIVRETYTNDGISKWVAGPRKIGVWMLDQNPLFMIAGLILYVAIFGLMTTIEWLVKHPVALAGVATVFFARVSVSRKKIKKL